jgi:hypothetical protein
MLVHKNGVSQIQIFEYSLLIIQWMKREFTLRKFTLQPLFHVILSLKSTFSHVSIMCVYMDMSIEEN